MNRVFSSRKGISTFVGFTFLLLLSVIAGISISIWYQDNLTGVLANFDSIEAGSLEILDFKNGYLRFSSTYSLLNITGLKLDDRDCNIVVNEYLSGSHLIDFSGCVTNTTSSSPEVVIVSDKGIFSKTVYYDKNLLDCDSLNGGEWLYVRGNSDLGTNDFCVMKYEAKATTSSLGSLHDSTNMYCGDGDDGGGNDCPTDGSVNVTSKPEYKPLTQIYQPEAQSLCENLGSGYHLITNTEWVTIARDIENLFLNWESGVVGVSYLFIGNSDNGIDGGTSNGAPLNASYDDNDGYYRTGDSFDSCDGSYTNMDLSDEVSDGFGCRGQKRTLILSSGEIIWDFSGNAWEKLNDTLTTDDSDFGLGVGDHDVNWTDISGYDSFEPYNSTFGREQGVGIAAVTGDSPSPVSDDPIHSIIRGGDFNNGDSVGIYNINTRRGPSFSHSQRSFRCAYAP